MRIHRYSPEASRLPHVLFTVHRDGTHELKEPYWYLDPNSGSAIGAWVGFKWDGCSIPRIIWPIVPPFSLSIVAGLFHDLLYGHGGKLPDGNVYPYRTFTREEADRIFADLMKSEGVPAIRRSYAHKAVRLFGGSAWNG